MNRPYAKTCARVNNKNALAQKFFARYLWPMNKLDEYLTNIGRGAAAQVARDAGTSEGRISRLRKGLDEPTLRMAFAIEKATGGDVPARSWIDTQKEKA
jgi:transcriptional regulator with XRE-family HTH domain